MQPIRRNPPISNHGWRNGSTLIVKKTFRHIDFPFVDDIVRHVHELSVALTTPKKNDLNAQELIERIGKLLCSLDQAAEAIEQIDIATLSHKAQDDLVELQRICDHLAHSVTVLQTMQKARYTTKFASQTQFAEWIEHEKEELVHLTDVILTHLVVFTLVTKHLYNAQVRRNIDSFTKRLDAVDRRHRRLKRRVYATLPDNRAPKDTQKSVRILRILFTAALLQSAKLLFALAN